MKIELSTIEIEPTAQHQYSIIWLHGLGANGHDFEGIVPDLNLNNQAATRFIFPNAPIQPVTINGGMKMNAWYDILEMTLQRKVDLAGIYTSANQIVQLIEREINQGILPKHILLAGFSQGGVIALHTGLRFPQRLAGIVALSTYLPTLEQLNTEATPANEDLPIFMAHGQSDPVVDFSVAHQVYTALLAKHYPIQWREYPMPHSVCTTEINEIGTFINSVFN